jgi:hypothetical protein
VANKIRPIICDLSCRWGDPLSTSIFKAEKIVGISYEFEGGNVDSLDEITLKNGLGKTELVKRSLDGKRGYVTFGRHGFPCGKAKLIFTSSDQEFRRARIIVWVYGERIKIESM